MAQVETAQRLVTAEEFYALPDDGQRRELLAGAVVTMALAGGGHGVWTGRLVQPLMAWVTAHEWGEVLVGEAGFIVTREPDTIRAPDAAMVARDRLPERDDWEPYWQVLPDLVLEVVSPTDRASSVMAKAQEWLDAGVTIVLVAWPTSRRVQVWRAADEARTFEATETLTLDDLLPGFSLPLAPVWR